MLEGTLNDDVQPVLQKSGNTATESSIYRSLAIALSMETNPTAALQGWQGTVQGTTGRRSRQR